MTDRWFVNTSTGRKNSTDFMMNVSVRACQTFFHEGDIFSPGLGIGQHRHAKFASVSVIGSYLGLTAVTDVGYQLTAKVPRGSVTHKKSRKSHKIKIFP